MTLEKECGLPEEFDKRPKKCVRKPNCSICGYCDKHCVGHFNLRKHLVEDSKINTNAF